MDKEGSGKPLLQYCHVDIKEDLLHWLKENGRLPSTSTEAYFSEIQELKQRNEEITELKEDMANLKEQMRISQQLLAEKEELLKKEAKEKEQLQLQLSKLSQEK